jgi:hypothetical protein
MARIRRKKALYEVINRNRSKTSGIPAVAPLHPEQQDKPKEQKAGKKKESARKVLQWPTKPKILQFHAGRIEISLPLQLAVALALGIVLIALLFFRLGQMSHSPATQNTTPSQNAETGNPPARPDVTESSVAPPAGNTVSSTANQIIILVQHDRYADLTPVQQHFAQFGVATQIVPREEKYFLVTTKRYENFASGSDGSNDLQFIKKIGASYKAPQGRETFARHLFSDAYGAKVWF